MNIFAKSLILVMLAACTSNKRPVVTVEKYLEDTQLMFKICSKFSHETDINRLHSAAVATQTSRIVACADFNNECKLYGKFISTAIKHSKDNIMSKKERTELREILVQLQIASNEGLPKLREVWQTYEKSQK